jgi:hypothetical protein
MAWIARVARDNEFWLCLAAAIACCDAAVAVSIAKFGADITAAAPSGLA